MIKAIQTTANEDKIHVTIANGREYHELLKIEPAFKKIPLPIHEPITMNIADINEIFYF
ncbi:hypothetical protein ONA00_03825 [Mycoplasmopsis cynos]|uniref:hypothetical protein n=1 Tax=Mycoplasmopsis cynos TaxID=171284 RepID=UPI0024C9E796|nr:hypothetical protein [Mycoplasmopsis cynos]WAM10498.1 hypothetical protein ONA00_03825 [Mycoplasmopsis cynos]